MPLVLNLSDDTMKQKILHIVIEEIKEGTCPIIIEKNGELLSVTDFDKKDFIIILIILSIFGKNKTDFKHRS